MPPAATKRNCKLACASEKVPVTTTETYAKGDVDFKAQLTKIKATNPDAADGSLGLLGVQAIGVLATLLRATSGSTSTSGMLNCTLSSAA